MIFFVFIAGLFSSNAHAVLYKWTDARGNLKFTDDPGKIPGAIREKAKVLPSAKAPDSSHFNRHLREMRRSNLKHSRTSRQRSLQSPKRDSRSKSITSSRIKPPSKRLYRPFLRNQFLKRQRQAFRQNRFRQKLQRKIIQRFWRDRGIRGPARALGPVSGGMRGTARLRKF